MNLFLRVGPAGNDERLRDACHRVSDLKRFHELGVLFAALRGDADVEIVHAELVRAVADVHLVLVEQARLEFGGGHAILDLEEHEIGAGGIHVDRRNFLQAL